MSAEARIALNRLVEAPRPCTMDKARDAFLALAAWRDDLRGRQRHGDDVAAELLRVNAAIALLWSAVMPMTGFRPGRLEMARAALGEE